MAVQSELSVVGAGDVIDLPFRHADVAQIRHFALLDIFRGVEPDPFVQQASVLVVQHELLDAVFPFRDIPQMDGDVKLVLIFQKLVGLKNILFIIIIDDGIMA